MDQNDNRQNSSDLQKSAKEFAKSGAEMLKHAKVAMKAGADIAAVKIGDAAGETGPKVINQAKGKLSAGVNAVAEKMENAAAGSDSALLKKATSTRKKTLTILVCAVVVILLLIMTMNGNRINSVNDAQTYVAKELKISMSDLLTGLDKPTEVKLDQYGTAKGYEIIDLKKGALYVVTHNGRIYELLDVDKSGVWTGKKLK